MLALFIWACWARPTAPAEGGAGERAEVPVEQSVAELANVDKEIGQIFAEVQANLEKQKFDAAFDALQGVLASDKMVFCRLPDAPSGQYVSPRAVANVLLARLPPAVLERYEKTQGAVARRLLEEAQQSGAEALLVQAGERYFHTQAGAQATNLLGAWRFDRGAFLPAGRAWERLYRYGRVGDPPLRGPGVDLPPLRGPGDKGESETRPYLPLCLAKAAVAYQLGGDPVKARQLLELLEREQAGAEAVVAGQKTRLADVVRRALSTPPPPPARIEPAADWPCFAGAPSGAALQKDTPGGSALVWVYPESGEARLARVNALLGREPRAPPPVGSASAGGTPAAPSGVGVETRVEDGLGFVSVTRTGRGKVTTALPAVTHPILQAGLLFHRDDQYVYAQDPATGRIAWRSGALPLYRKHAPNAGLDNPYLAFAGDLGRYSLTAGDGHLYVVYGHLLHGPGIPTDEGPEGDGSRLAALRLGASDDDHGQDGRATSGTGFQPVADANHGQDGRATSFTGFQPVADANHGQDGRATSGTGFQPVADANHGQDGRATSKVVWELGNAKGDQDLTRLGKYLTAPTYAAGRLYVVVRYSNAYYALCLEARTGKTLWSALLGPVPVSPFRSEAWEFGYTMELLTERGSPPSVADGLVFVTTNAGLVVALSCRDGRPVWAVPYRSPIAARDYTISEWCYSLPLAFQPRYPQNPLIATGGRVIAAPCDSEAVLAFEAQTGRLLWSCDRAGQRDLSLLDGERLLLSGPGLVVLNLRDGKVLKQFEVGDITGRPAVAPETVWASGRGRLLRLDPRTYALTPLPVTDPEAVLGELLTCDGFLIAAGPGGLAGYLEARGGTDPLAQRLEQTKDPAERFGLYLRRGQRALGTPSPNSSGAPTAEAEAAFRAAEQEAAKVPAANLDAQVRPWLYRVLVRRAGEAKDGAELDRLLEQAGKYAGDPRAEAGVLVRGIRGQEKLGCPERAAALAQRLADQFSALAIDETVIEGVTIEGMMIEGMRELTTTKEEGAPSRRTSTGAVHSPDPSIPQSLIPPTGYVFGQAQIARLIQAHGAKVYAAGDEAARRALEEGRQKKDAQQLLDAQWRYRHSAAAGPLLFAAAELLYAEATRAKTPEEARPHLARVARILGQIRNYPDMRKELAPRAAQSFITSRLTPQLLPLLHADLQAVNTSAEFAGTKVDLAALFAQAKSAAASALSDRHECLSSCGPSGLTAPVQEVYRIPAGGAGVPARPPTGEDAPGGTQGSRGSRLLRDTRSRAVRLGDRVVLWMPKGLVCLDTQCDDFQAGTVWTAATPAPLGPYCVGHWSADLRQLAVLDRKQLLLLDSVTGEMRHQVKLADWGIAEWFDVAAAGDWLVFSSSSGRLVAVNLTPPAVRWQRPPDRDSAGPKRLELAGGVLMVKEISYRDPPNGFGTCYDLQDGKVLYRPERRNHQALLTGDGLAVYRNGETLSVRDPWRGDKAAPFLVLDFRMPMDGQAKSESGNLKSAIRHAPAEVLAVGRQHLLLDTKDPGGALEILDLVAPASKAPLQPGGSAMLTAGGAVAAVMLKENVAQPPPAVPNGSTAGGGCATEDRIFVLSGKANGGTAGPYVKLLAPAVSAHETATGRMLWRRELVPEAAGYCLVSWLEESGGCLSLALLPADSAQPAQGFVVDEQTGAATAIVPAVPRDPDAGSRLNLEPPAVLNGCAVLETKDALILFRSRL